MSTVPSPWPAAAAALGSPDLSQLHLALGLAAQESDPHPALSFPAADGRLLRGRVFEPQGPARAVAVLAPATGVPQRFYAPFAAWLATQGYAVLCFDYRGMGQSRAAGPGSMLEWAREDLSGALALALQRADRAPTRLPLLWVGHSLGGNCLPLVQGLDQIDAVITVGSQLAYWKYWSGAHRALTVFFFKTWLPLWVRLLGRFPGWLMGGGETLPAQAALDWSRWGQAPGYYRDDPRCAAWVRPQDFRGVMHLWSIDDDRLFGPQPAVDALAASFAASPGRIERVHLHPREIGLRKLGHFGPFRRAIGERLWPLLLRRIEAAAPVLKPGSVG